MHVVVNHLRFRDPVPSELIAKAQAEVLDDLSEAGCPAAHIVQVDERHLILVLFFTSHDEAQRIAAEIGGPWMRENVSHLLADGTDRSLGEVVASTDPL